MTKEIVANNLNAPLEEHTDCKLNRFKLTKTNETHVEHETDLDEDVDVDGEDAEDVNKVIEESPNGRWSKLDSEIFVQKLLDFDSAHLAIDTDKGYEIAWNEMRFNKQSSKNRFDSVQHLEMIYEKLRSILNFLINLDHSNILKFYDFWFVNDSKEAKLVVITEYSSAGSLKRILDSSKKSQTKIKSETFKRWLNQIINSIKFLHSKNISIFQGNFNSETIFIQSSGVIKLTPILLSLSGVCEFVNHSIRCAATSSKKNMDFIKLNDEITIKDLHAIGRLAYEIFTINFVKTQPQSPTGKGRLIAQSSFEILAGMKKDDEQNLILNYNMSCLDDELQKDFIVCCLSATNETTIDSIWFHPYINYVYSLKVLSVFSLLTYFQDIKSTSPSVSQADKSNGNSNEIDSNKNHDDKSDNLNMQEICTTSSKQENDEHSEANSKIIKSQSPSKTSTASRKDSESPSSQSTNSERRKVSLTFLTNCNLKIPHHFFFILEEIRSGLYPRLFKTEMIQNLNTINFKTIQQQQQQQIGESKSSSAFFSSSNANNEPTEKAIGLYSEGAMVQNQEEENIHQIDNDEENLTNGPYEIRRLTSENCTIKKCENESNKIELSLDFKFSDNFHRLLNCFFPIDFVNYFDVEQSMFKFGNLINIFDESPYETKIENICIHLANELIDFGLINPKDRFLITDLIFRTMKEYLSQLVFEQQKQQVLIESSHQNIPT
jgi:hypothetical protein